jgi:GxxExxY protein
MTEETFRQLTERVIGAAIEVHRHLGPGLLESTYHKCLAHELSLRGIRFRMEVHVPIQYKGLRLQSNYELDFLIEEVLILELKTVERLQDIHFAQLLTYLKAMSLEVGLLINFNSVRLVDGLERVVNNFGQFPQTTPGEDTDLQA